MCFVLGQLVVGCHTEQAYKPFGCFASHGYHYRVYLCSCLLFTKGYLVADAITYPLSLHCSNVVLSMNTHQCQIDTTPSWIEVLVPRFQEPLTADLLSELSSTHEVHV